MNKKKSSIITPPPNLDETDGNAANALDLSEDQRKEALIKLIRKGAPSVAAKEGREEDPANERIKYTLRLNRSVIERMNRAAAERDIPTPLNTWITEAIFAQLKREGF